jgi:hypothetical protein
MTGRSQVRLFIAFWYQTSQDRVILPVPETFYRYGLFIGRDVKVLLLDLRQIDSLLRAVTAIATTTLHKLMQPKSAQTQLNGMVRICK